MPKQTLHSMYRTDFSTFSLTNFHVQSHSDMERSRVDGRLEPDELSLGSITETESPRTPTGETVAWNSGVAEWTSIGVVEVAAGADAKLSLVLIAFHLFVCFDSCEMDVDDESRMLLLLLGTGVT